MRLRILIASILIAGLGSAASANETYKFDSSGSTIATRALRNGTIICVARNFLTWKNSRT